MPKPGKPSSTRRMLSDFALDKFGFGTSPVTTFGGNNLVTSTVVDLLPDQPAMNGNQWYRSRSRAQRRSWDCRTGLDDRMGAGTRGDSLLRKIDFNTDHFIATYGPNGEEPAKRSSLLRIRKSHGGSNKSLRPSHRSTRPSRLAGRLRVSATPLMSIAIGHLSDPTTPP